MGGVSFLPVVEHQDETRAAYDGIVELYASMFANRLEMQPFARNMIGAFAELVRGTGNPRAADVGCGPGHLTAMLHDLELEKPVTRATSPGHGKPPAFCWPTSMSSWRGTPPRWMPTRSRGRTDRKALV